MNRLHSLDGLRAVACILVLLHHLGAAAIATKLRHSDNVFFGNLLGSFTGSGVELFFVLSAVLLVGPYVRGEKQLNLKLYLGRRIERLIPPYLAAWCLAGLAIYLATNYPTWWTESASLPTFSILSWVQQIGIVYFGTDRYNFAWWSLTTEVAFYVVIPLLIPLFARFYKRPMLLGAVYFGSIILATLVDIGSIHIGTPVARDLALYGSCFCAGLVLSCHIPSKKSAYALAVLGILWVSVMCFLNFGNVHIGYGLLYFGAVALAMHPESFLSSKLSSFLWVWIGERSYSLFLIHFSIIGLVCHAASLALPNKSLTYFVATRVASLIFSFLAAIFVFHFIERRAARNLATANAIWPWDGMNAKSAN